MEPGSVNSAVIYMTKSVMLCESTYGKNAFAEKQEKSQAQDFTLLGEVGAMQAHLGGVLNNRFPSVFNRWTAVA